ncbi:MAG: hypothetical protein M1826_001542 [Phylliscum demangeonii]|nr:MAG: hypothetical protein M1826_001542 [Phylliscum demangeonii]
MAVITISDQSALIASGGDDNSISLTRIDAGDSGCRPLLNQVLRIPKAHACAVTAIALLPQDRTSIDRARTRNEPYKCRLATSSPEQRLKIWSVIIRAEGKDSDAIDVRKEANLPTFVADASSMDLWPSTSGDAKLFLCGVGIDIWTMNPDEPAIKVD